MVIVYDAIQTRFYADQLIDACFNAVLFRLSKLII